MDFTVVIQDLENSKLAARRYQRDGHGKFRDLVTVCRNGKLRFERFCYGEAAGSVCVLWAPGADAEGTIQWDMSGSHYSGREEAPRVLTAVREDGALELDGGRLLWLPSDDLKVLAEAGLGRFGMLFGKKKKD